MVIPNNNISYCEICELEYAAPAGTTCPLCPFRARHEDAVQEIRNSEPCRILERVASADIQASINRLAASGWALADFRIAHAQDHGRGLPIYVAVLQRANYDPERHRSAVDAEINAFAHELAKQREIEVETEAFMDTLSTRVWG